MRALLLLLTACGGPSATNATCPDPDPYTLTWDTFGRDFMAKYCIGCHNSKLTTLAERHDAPFYHDYDLLESVRETRIHIDRYTGFGPDAENTHMPPNRCPSTPGGPLDRDCLVPTPDERRDLATWLACEQNRPFYRDAGPD